MKTQNTHTNTNKRKKGFSLVELIVVIAILAVLSVTAVMSVGNISNQAADAAMQSDANTVVRALNTYNAMAGSIITGDGAGGTQKIADVTLSNLSLSTGSGDLIDMALGVNIDANRLSDLLGGYTMKTDSTKTLTVSYDGNMWISTIA